MTLFKGEICHFCSTSRTKQIYDSFSNYFQPLINIRNVSNSYPSPNSLYWCVWPLGMFKQNRNAALHLYVYIHFITLKTVLLKQTSRKWMVSPLQKARTGLIVFCTATNCQANKGTLAGSVCIQKHFKCMRYLALQ